MGRPGKVWWDQGAAIACEHEGCKCSSDDYDDVRGFVRKDFRRAEEALIAHGWLIDGDDKSAAMNTNRHYCPEHWPDAIKRVYSEWMVDDLRRGMIEALKK